MAGANLARINKFDQLENPFSTGESFASLFEESMETEKSEGTVTKGKIVRIENDFVIVDVGLKSEGFIPLREFQGPGRNEELRVGDDIDIYIERLENREGKTVLSREKALREEAWERLEKVYAEGQNVNGTIFGRVKGGFTVDVQGVAAFLPGSQVDIRPIKDITPLMNIEQPFQILKMDRRQGNIVVSRRAILEESRQEERDELLSHVKEGQVMDGIVKNITDYGAFIDLGSIDGLLHVTDISWSRISHPSEVLSLGQKLKVKVIKFNEETKRISLGIKQLESNPWDGIEKKYPIGSRLKGHVTNITDYGAFIELEPGIEGLVHVSEISWTKNNVHPRKLLSTSQEVEVVVLDIDPEKHRISLGIKQCEANPWKKFAETHQPGTIVDGEVKNIVDFGMFVGFEGEIDGLVHISDISWSGKAEDELKNFAPGTTIKVKILSCDPDKQRISLGIKQLGDDPMAGAFNDLQKGDTVTCLVTAVQDDGIEVSVKDDTLKAFIKRADLSRDRVEQRPERFAIGDRVDAKIVSLDKPNRKIGLSIKSLEMEVHKKAIEEFGSTDSGASLGDILGAALDKSKAEKSAKDGE
ncbi:MAG: rpsA [Rickettsiales bacterium]|jgi:small subunit ribosomal protein S1|nr:rpsA [Rickettsiales bacterium]